MTIDYISRTKAYYRALGFERDYTWANNAETPLSQPRVTLKNATVTLITTAVVEPSIPKPVRTAASYAFSEVPEHFDTSELAWDKVTTHTRDRESYFPINELKARSTRGEFKALSQHFHFVPTEYSQRHTREVDAPLILQQSLKDNVDLAILIPL